MFFLWVFLRQQTVKPTYRPVKTVKTYYVKLQVVSTYKIVLKKLHVESFFSLFLVNSYLKKIAYMEIDFLAPPLMG